MTGGNRKNPVLANPFYIALIFVSTLFVVTALGYLVVPYALERAGGASGSGSSTALAGWLDRNGPMILGIEFVIMFVSGIAAMLTDDRFARS
jgi:hypothetical protein